MTDIKNCGKDLIAYLAIELERAAREHSFAAADLAAVRLALVGGLITPYQETIRRALSRDSRGHTTGPLGVALDLICGEGER